MCVGVLFAFCQTGSIMAARWPTLLGDGTVNDVAIEAVHHLIKVTHEFRVRLKKMLDMKGKVSLNILCFSKHCYYF